MKKNYLAISAFIVLSGLMACNNATNDVAKQDAVSLSQYVDSVAALPPVYTQEYWTVIDNAYQVRAMKAEQTIATLEAADKARAEAAKEKYEALKADYTAKIKVLNDAALNPVVSTDYRTTLRSNLFGEGKIGKDMKFEFVTAANIHDVYKNFVDKVADNKNKYTREDWDEIKVLYEALDTRKNVVEKDLATRDNLKIATLKVRLTSIIATHRGGTKVKENSDSKN